jgi:5'-3' exonuclease
MDMPKLLIIDADFLLYTATMGNKCLDNEGNPIKEDNKFTYTDKTEEEVYQCADQILSLILNNSSADFYIGYLGNCKSFRYGIYPEYKGNRVNKITPKYLNELKIYLLDKWNFIFTEEGLEADDAVNIVRNNFKNDFNCTIVSSDKDLIKSIEGSYINARNLEKVETSEKDATRFFWKSMITGDVADNIKGLTGKGEVYANKLVEFAEERNIPLHMEVLDRYIRYFDTTLGIEEFYKNYKCLHILDEFSNFVIPELNNWSSIPTENKEEIKIEGI